MMPGYRNKLRPKLMKPWIVSHILNDPTGVLATRARVVKVTNLLQNIAGSKESLKHVADGETYIKAKFSEKAVKLFQDEMEEESQTDWQNSSTCMIILQQFRVEFEPGTHLSQCQYILVVEKFKLWDLQEGFSIKNNNLMFCMGHEEVKKKAEQDWKKFREDREESMPLSELLAEMACPSLEENTEASQTDQQQSGKQHSVDYDSVEQHIDHLPDSLLKQLYSTFSYEEIHIKDEELKILSELTEWKADYRPSPAQSSEEPVQDHNYSLSECQVSSMNTLAADNPPRGTSRGGKGNRAKQSGRSIDPRDEAGRSSTRPSTPPALCNRKQGSKAITIPGSQSSQYSNGQASQVSVYSQDSAQWQQDLESVHLSCDESLDIGSPSAESTPVEIHYSSVRKARKSHPEDTGSCSSSLEYLGLVTQTSGVRPNKSSSDVAMGLEKKVGTDSSSEGVDEPDSQIKSDSSPSILNPIESRMNSEFKSVNQTEMQNIHLQSSLEPVVKVEVDEIREEATKQNSVLNNSECLSISCTRQLEFNVNVSSSNSVISPSPKAEVSIFAPSAITGIVCGLTSQRIRKTQEVKNLCNQLVSTADETGNEHYLTALEASIDCQNISETELGKERARMTRSKTRTLQDDDDIDKTHQADDSQQGQSCYKTKSADNSSPLHDNAIHCTNVTVNRVVETTEDSLIRNSLQSSDNGPNQNLESSLQSTSEKSLILEYYIKGQSPKKKINKDCLVERANSFMENFKVTNSSQTDNRNTTRSDTITDLARKHEGSMSNIKRRSPRLSGKINVDSKQVVSNDKGNEKTSKQGKEKLTDSSNEESLSEEEINNNEVSSENFSFRELASSEDSSCSEDEQLHAIIRNAEQTHISDIDAAKSSAVLSKNVPQTPDRSSKSEKRRQTNHCTQDKRLQSNKSDSSSCKNKNSDVTNNVNKKHTNDICDKAIISGCGPQDLAFSEIDRHRPNRCENVDNNLRKRGDISMKKSSGSNNEKILDTEQSDLSLQKTPNNKVLGDKIVSSSVETGKCLNGKTNSPLQISANKDGLDNLTSEKVHAFREPSSSREMNSDESLETEGTPDLLGGTQPFEIEHLKQKSPTETLLPDILTGTQGFNTAYSETQGFVPDLSGSMRSLSCSSNEQSSLNSSGENGADNAKSLTQGFDPVLSSSSRSLSNSSNETSLLNSSDEKRVNQLISPDSILERPRLNRKVRSTNSVVNNVSNQYSAELKAEELRLENLTKPSNSGVTDQFVLETVESLNITEKTSDRLVNKNQDDIIIISSGSSIEEFTETEVKKKDNYMMNRAEKINSDLSERSISHQNGQGNIQTNCFNGSDNTVIDPLAINSSSEGLDGNIQIQVDSLKQLLAGVRVQPVNRDHSKYTVKRRKIREKNKNEPKGNVLRVKPVYNANRKGQTKQSVSGKFINLIDSQSESEPEIHFDKNTKMKTYSPEKVVIDGRTFENKKKWMNFVESPFPQPRKSTRKSFRIDIFDNQEKTAAVNSTARSVGRDGLVYKKVDGVYHFDRESKEGTQYNSRTSTNSTPKNSKHVAPDVKIVDTNSQSIDNLEEGQKDTNGLNNEENASDSSSNGALKCSFGNSPNENENLTAYKEDKKIITSRTRNNSYGKNGNNMNNKKNVSEVRLNAGLKCSLSNSLNENKNLKDCQTNANNIPKTLKPIVELRKVDEMCHSIDILVGQEQGGSSKEFNNKENISDCCSNAAVKSSSGNNLTEKEILNMTTETSLFSESNSEVTRNSKTVCRKRKSNADGDGKSCKVQRLTDVPQNIKTFTGLSREMRQANITAFFKNTERKSKYMQGLDLRNSLTQDWIDKQIFEGDSENCNSHLEGTHHSAVEDVETGSKVERRTTRSRAKEVPGYLEWEKLWTSGKLEPTSDLGKKMLQLKLSSDLETAVTRLLRK